MPIKRRARINIDKMRVSLSQPKDLFGNLNKYIQEQKEKKKGVKADKKMVVVSFADFDLLIKDDGTSQHSDKPSIKIIADVILTDGSVLGEFTFNNSAKYDGLCFFTFSNAALYSGQNTLYGDGQTTWQTYLMEVANTLGLTVNTQTEVELAIDVNFNPIPHLRSLIKDVEHYDMIYNNKCVVDPDRTLDNYGEYFGRSRRRLHKYPTLYFSQKDREGLSLKCYDKSREIAEESLKQYIKVYDDFGDKRKIFRFEFTVKWKQFQRWLENIEIDDSMPSEWRKANGESDTDHLERSQSLLMTDAYKCALWQFCADRLLYFRHKMTKEFVSLFDIVAEGTDLEKFSMATDTPFVVDDTIVVEEPEFVDDVDFMG